MFYYLYQPTVYDSANCLSLHISQWFTLVREPTYTSTQTIQSPFRSRYTPDNTKHMYSVKSIHQSTLYSLDLTEPSLQVTLLWLSPLSNYAIHQPTLQYTNQSTLHPCVAQSTCIRYTLVIESADDLQNSAYNQSDTLRYLGLPISPYLILLKSCYRQ